MIAYLEDCSFRHILDRHMDGLDLFAVIWFIHNLAGILDSFFLRTEPSRDIIDVGNLLLS